MSGAMRTAIATATARIAMLKIEDHDVQDVQDDLDGQEDDEYSQDVQQDLLSFSGATAPEILRVSMSLCLYFRK